MASWFRHCVLALSATMALALSAQRPAAACGSCGCMTMPPLMPNWTAADSAPLNARYLLTTRRYSPEQTDIDPESVRWVNATDGTEVAVDRVSIAANEEQYWLVPRAPLAPSTEYRIEIAPDNDAIEVLALFTTGTDIDVDAPVVGESRIVHRSESSFCEPLMGAFIELDSVFDSAFSSAELVVQLEVSGGSVSSQQLYRARNTTATQELPLLAASDAGGRDCLGLNAIPDGELGQEYSVVATFYDIAGNSASSGPLSFTLSEVKAADCSASVVPESSTSVGGAPASPPEPSEPSTLGVAPDGEAEGCAVQGRRAGNSLGVLLFLMGTAFVRRRSRGDRHGVRLRGKRARVLL